MISLAAPWALALAIPAAVAWWHLARSGHGRWWRLALLALLVLAAARPQLTRDDGGSDVVLVLDRSASMGAAVRNQDEQIRLAGEARHHGDRLAVVAFGAAAAVAQGPQAEGVPRLADVQIDAEGSDIDAALDTAAALVAPGRSARVILASDGEATGADPRRAAARLALMGVPVDVLPERHGAGSDAAIADLDLPGELRQGESFIGSLVLVTDRPERRAWRVRRGQAVVASDTAELAPGRAVSVGFVDRPSAPGLASYTAELDDRDDRQPANNRASGWVRVLTGERILVVGGDGTPGNVAKALSAAGLDVATRSAGPLGMAELLGCSTVVLAEVPAGDIGHAGMSAIARWVQHLGGGLVMTGGRRSFGCGGWYRSPVEPILPVSLEVRDEHRVLSVAMAIAIDRSGSMAAQCADGRQKIALAAEGAAAAIELLGPRDRIAVFAVDTAPHDILPMQAVNDPKALASQVLGMESMGAGIYIHEALEAAGAALLRTEAGTRHLLLFADADDSLQHPGEYRRIIGELRSHGITVSVVGMGTDQDSGAKLLTEVAGLGGGRLSFAADPADIPRLFAQETVLVARNPWVDQRIPPTPQGGLLAAMLGASRGPLQGNWPAMPGYNLTYARPRAQVLAWCQGDPKAPAVAAWNVGGGRSVALPIPCDSADNPEFPRWAGYAPLLASCARWAAGGSGAAPGALTARRHGGVAEVRLELDRTREAEWPAEAPELQLVSDDPAQPTRPVALEPVDRGIWSAQVRLPAGRPLLPAVRLGGATLVGPPLAAPMPAEVAPRRDLPPGDQVLAGIAETTGGTVRGDLLRIFANPPSRGVAHDLAPWLVCAAIAVLMLEVAVRRMRFGLPALRLPRWRLRLPRWTTAPAPAPAATATAPQPPANGTTPAVEAPPAAPVETPSAKTGGLLQALDEAKRRR